MTDIPVPIFDQQTVATLPTPWSMTMLPDGNMLITERPPHGETVTNPAQGHMYLVTQGGAVSLAMTGIPDNVGMLDVKLDPNFDQNHYVYFSYINSDPTAARVGRNAADTTVNPAGIVVARAVLDESNPLAPQLTGTSVIWQQTPLIVSNYGSGEPGGRLAFAPDGAYLYIAAGDRQEFAPVQSLDNTLGKIIRIHPDGSIPADNPYVGVSGADPSIWSLGHRNPYGLVFDSNGVLWENEMGPKGGDELNVIHPGDNYGWPNVSYGDGYDGTPFPKPAPGDGYDPAALQWTPVIAPSGMISYTGTAISSWTGDLIASGLQSHGLVIVQTDGETADEVARLGLGQRTRDVMQAPDGSLWVLYDQPDGRLVHLTVASGTSITSTDHGTIFVGNASSNVIQGGALDDTLTGGAGADTLSGGPGHDLFTDTAAQLSGDTITDFAVGDAIHFQDADPSSFAFSLSGSTLTYTGGTMTLQNLPASARLLEITPAGGGVELVLAPGTTPTGLSGDFNGDGKADLLWHNDVTGQMSNWLGQADGSFLVNDAHAFNQVGIDWTITGIGDFNGDGRDDIVWRNMKTGQMSDWLGQADGSFVVNDAHAFNQVSLSWSIIGSGDFNGDGRTDLFWRDSNTGQISDWLGTSDGGFTVNDDHAYNHVNPSWTVVGFGDFNGDGHDDLLWYNASTGQMSDWLGQSDGGFTVNDAHAANQVGSDWQIAGTGDFNGDGRADILWHNDASGQFSDWLGQADGGFVVNDAHSLGVVGIDWTITGIGDYNGDGRDDIAWRDVNGNFGDWLAQPDGSFAANGVSNHAVPTDWHLV